MAFFKILNTGLAISKNRYRYDSLISESNLMRLNELPIPSFTAALEVVNHVSLSERRCQSPAPAAATHGPGTR